MRKMILCLSFLLIIAGPLAFAQQLFPEIGPIFKDESVVQIWLQMAEEDLDNLLAPGNEWAEDYYPATFVFDNGTGRDTVEEVGLRLRGNTSRLADKKSFKLSFNTFQPGRKYKGLEKMNINGEHNDPTIARSKLCWELCRQLKVPAPRANHVDLYINEEYFGLYTHVEHIDEVFVKLRYGRNDGNLYKCLWPADLDYLGSDPNLYKMDSGGRRAYDLKTNTEEDDYNDLAHFIDVLNNSSSADFPCELEAVFNVQSYLRAAAMDVLTGNWDGPIYNKNNFYLYHNTLTGQFEYIPYDLDNTLGINFFPGGEWSNRNVYKWSPNESRPLYDRLMAHPVYRDQYSYYLEQFLNEIYTEAALFPYVDMLRTKIHDSAAADPHRPLDYDFSITDFEQNFEQPIPFSHTPFGIKPFITARRNSALQQLESFDIQPIITQVISNQPSAGQDISWSARVADDGQLDDVRLYYQLEGQSFKELELFDDGQHQDGLADDGRFAALLPALNEAGNIKYYIEAEDDSGQQSRYPVCGEQNLTVRSTAASLYLNELMARNETTIADEAGEFDDWLEIYNGGSEAIYLGDKFLSDNPVNPDKWPFPDVSIEPGEFILIWADEDESQGEWHTNFKLSAAGESLGIYDAADQDFAIIDQLDFTQQTTDRAFGRIPNGTGPFQEVAATPGASNVPLGLSLYSQAEKTFTLFPNPANQLIHIQLEWPAQQKGTLHLLDQHGRILREIPFNGSDKLLECPLDNLPQAWYTIRLLSEEGGISNQVFFKF